MQSGSNTNMVVGLYLDPLTSSGSNTNRVPLLQGSMAGIREENPICLKRKENNLEFSPKDDKKRMVEANPPNETSAISTIDDQGKYREILRDL